MQTDRKVTVGNGFLAVAGTLARDVEIEHMVC